MSFPHIAPGGVIDISPYGPNVESAISETFIRQSHIEVQVYFKTGKKTPEHTAAGAVTLQCIKSEVELV